MDKKEFLLRQIAKTNKKNYENYVVTRVIHQLDDLSIKVVTQQYVTRRSGRALTDLYFPQIGVHVEVDEASITRVHITWKQTLFVRPTSLTRPITKFFVLM